jgi:integrase
MESNDVSLLDISKKLAALLALCSAQRVQTLTSIKLNEIQFVGNNNVVIRVHARLKTSKPGSIFEMKFNNFTESQLCLVQCLKCYMSRTANVRNSDNLFISTKAPYNTVSNQTLSNWLKSVLQMAGIDSSKFTSHSYRHSSTSKAASAGISTDVIFKSAGWTERSKVFANFYKRPIVKSNEFAHAILSSCN